MSRLGVLAVCATIALNCQAVEPAGLISVGPERFIVTDSLERLGNAIHFATVNTAEPFTTVAWYVAHCERRWVTDAVAFSIFPHNLEPLVAYRKGLQDTNRFSMDGADFYPSLKASPDLGGTDLDRVLVSLCKRVPISQSNAELPIAGTSRVAGREAFTDYLILRTVIRKGSKVEGWTRRRPVKTELWVDKNGDQIRRSDGTPAVLGKFTDQDALARFKITADCDTRQLAISRYTEYRRDDSINEKVSSSSPKLVFEEPIPGTIGEAQMQALCQF